MCADENVVGPIRWPTVYHATHLLHPVPGYTHYWKCHSIKSLIVIINWCSSFTNDCCLPCLAITETYNGRKYKSFACGFWSIHIRHLYLYKYTSLILSAYLPVGHFSFSWWYILIVINTCLPVGYFSFSKYSQIFKEC